MLNQNTLSAPSYFNSLARLVSNAGFKKLMSNEDYKQYGLQMKRLLKKNGTDFSEKKSIKQLIEISYEQLLNNYRHEYLYKTALLNSYILKNYHLSDTLILNEFSIGKSKADMVLVNGVNKVFEIKTELDTPDRLELQIADYYKAFSEVNIVVHHSLVNKYLSLINEKVGILTFAQDNTIQVVRESLINHSHLDIETMMKSLRKDEYLAVIKNLAGYIPETKPVFLFKACLQIANQYSPKTFQGEYLKIIKKRINKETNSLVVKEELPEPIRFTCYHSNLKQNDYIALTKRLNHQL